MRIAFLALVFSCQLAAGQSIPELRALLSSDDDSTKVATMGRLSSMYTRSNTDSAFYFGRAALAFAREVKLDFGEASANNALGTIYFFQSDYDSAIFYYNECLKISEKLNDSLRIGAMLNNIGTVLTYQTKYDSSLEVLFRARELRMLIDDPKITSTVNNIGNAYQRMQDWEKALEYYEEAAALKEKYEQTLSLSNTLNNIGIVLKQMDRAEEAIPYYEKSLKIAEDFNDKIKQANAHNNLAALYHLSPDLYGQAETHYRKSIALKEEMGDKTGLFNSYTQLADLLSASGKAKEARDFIYQAEKLGEEIGQNLFTSAFLKTKASILYRSGQKDQAFEALNEAYELKTEEMALDRNEKIA
ncbi:MAG: tetratricopeptide repeat protein, partial [Cyclobacteriaceae bacterium]